MFSLPASPPDNCSLEPGTNPSLGLMEGCKIFLKIWPIVLKIWSVSFKGQGLLWFACPQGDHQANTSYVFIITRHMTSMDCLGYYYKHFIMIGEKLCILVSHNVEFVFSFHRLSSIGLTHPLPLCVKKSTARFVLQIVKNICT